MHRDIKPANVLVARGDEEDDEHVYLTDFGIARRTDGESLTRTGLFVGTVDYTAPERFQGGRGDASSDIYSFGCVLFEALTGHVPYERPTSVSKIYAHVADPIPSASAEVPGVPEALDAIIAKAMAKNPEDRYGSAGELAAALGQALQALDTSERLVAGPTQPDPPDAATPTVVGDDAATRLAPTDATEETEKDAATRLAPADTEEDAATRLTPADTEEDAATRLAPTRAPADTEEDAATRLAPAETAAAGSAPAPFEPAETRLVASEAATGTGPATSGPALPPRPRRARPSVRQKDRRRDLADHRFCGPGR